MPGLLVHGDNHFVVRGPLPNRTVALALARHWTVIQIGRVTPEELGSWQISSREYREDLRWAVVVPAEAPIIPAIAELLGELKARGVRIHDASADNW